MNLKFKAAEGVFDLLKAGMDAVKNTAPHTPPPKKALVPVTAVEALEETRRLNRELALLKNLNVGDRLSSMNFKNSSGSVKLDPAEAKEIRDRAENFLKAQHQAMAAWIEMRRLSSVTHQTAKLEHAIAEYLKAYALKDAAAMNKAFSQMVGAAQHVVSI